MNGKEDLWRDWYSEVLTSAHLRNVLLTPHNDRRDEMLAPLMRSLALRSIGSSPTTSSILSQIRQARDYEIRCLHHCLLPWDGNKYMDRQGFSYGCKSSTATPSGKTPVLWVSLSHPQCVLCMCLSRRSRLRTLQGSGLGSTPPHLADGRSRLTGVRLEGVPALQIGIPLLEDRDLLA